MVELSNVIPASPDRIFSVLSDLNQAREWMPTIQKIEPLTQGPFGVGTCVSMGVTVDGKPAKDVSKEIRAGKYDKVLSA